MKKNILEIEFFCDDFHEKITIKEYFIRLLLELWQDGEGFNGKRPFGNSGWDYQIYQALVKNGIVEGVLDSEGYLEHFDQVEADKLIIEAIKNLGN